MPQTGWVALKPKVNSVFPSRSWAKTVSMKSLTGGAAPWTPFPPRSMAMTSAMIPIASMSFDLTSVRDDSVKE